MLTVARRPKWKSWLDGCTVSIMRRTSLISVFGLLLVLGPLCLGQSSDPIRVLFLGNSVFNHQGGLYRSFMKFCDAGGLTCQVASQHRAPKYAQSVEFLGFGRIPVNLPEVAADEKIHELIISGGFDYVVLDGRRPGYLLPAFVTLPTDRPYGESIPYQKNLEALGNLHRTIAESGAQTVIYMHPGPHQLVDVKHAMAQIYMKLRSDLEKREVGRKGQRVILVPASLLWLDAIKRFGMERWYSDATHGTPLARYASACMLHTYLTGSDSRNNNSLVLPRDWNKSPEEPDDFAEPREAEWIKNQVWLYYSTRPE